MIKPRQMTAHQLARDLMAQADLPVTFMDSYIGPPMVVLSVYEDNEEEVVVIDIGELED